MNFEPVNKTENTIVIIGGGESLRGYNLDDLYKLKNVAIMTVNNVVFHLKRADYWMTVDPMWKGEPQRGMTEQFNNTDYYCAFPDLEKTPQDKSYYKTVNNVHYLERIVPIVDNVKNYQLQEDKSKITTGDSIYGCIGLAYHLEATKIALLGVDVYGFGHWYDKDSPYNAYNQSKQAFNKYKNRIPKIYAQSVDQIIKRGIKIVNFSQLSKITCYPKDSLDNLIKFLQ